MKLRILVVGGGDVIAAEIRRALAASDWAQPFAVDPVDASALGRALVEADAVVDATAGGPSRIEVAARALYAAATALAKAPRIVQLGSMSVYGAATGTVDERAPLQGRGAYARARIAAEQLARRCPDALTLRCGVEYGRGNPAWSGRVARWLRAGRLGDLGAAGEGICNLVHVDDVVAATLTALRAPGLGGAVFNLAMPFAPTWNGYLAAYAAALGALPLRRISGLRLQAEGLLLAPPLKIAEILAAKTGRGAPPPPIPPSLLRGFRQRLRLDSTAAERELGLRWMPLAAGLAEAAASSD